MPGKHSRIEHQVSENTQRLEQADGRFVTVDSAPSRDERAENLRLHVSSPSGRWSVRERDLGDTLVMGHSDPEHGIGRGELGDRREPWMEVLSNVSSSTAASASQHTASVLAGNGAIGTIAAGDGDDPPLRSDAELTSRTGSWDAVATADDSGVRVTAYVSIDADTPDDVAELGVESVDGELIARAAGDATSLNDEADELLLTAGLEYEGIAARGGAVTEVGDRAVASMVAAGPAIGGIAEVAIGAGRDSAARSDVDLADPIDSRAADVSASGRTVEATAQWPADEPNGQPFEVSELGFVDVDGQLIARTVFKPVPLDEEVSPSFGGLLTVISR